MTSLVETMLVSYHYAHTIHKHDKQVFSLWYDVCVCVLLRQFHTIHSRQQVACQVGADPVAAGDDGECQCEDNHVKLPHKACPHQDNSLHSTSLDTINHLPHGLIDRSMVNSVPPSLASGCGKSIYLQIKKFLLHEKSVLWSIR